MTPAPGTISKGKVWASPQEHGKFQLLPSIPSCSEGRVEGRLHEDDFAPEWDHDTDTLASFLTWKSAQHHTESTTNTVTALLGPICEFVRTEVRYQLQKHSINVKLPELQDRKASEAETQKQILRLTETITELTKEVATLTKQVTTLSASKEKTKRETVLPKPYPTADRQIIFSLSSAPNDRKEAADRALQLINNTITNHNDITHPPFILANITNSNNLVFTVAHQHLGKNYEPYLAIFEDALHEFPIVSSRISQRWSRFIVHGIPTSTTPETVRNEIESTYPTLQMGQTPRWLTSPERRQGKEASSMVITLVGEITKKSLGADSLTMFNRQCKVTEYITFSPSTRCNKCQLYGHPTQRCAAASHTCAVCAQPHATKDHPCAIANCRAGHSCNHPPIRCVNCEQPHKASDRNCPTYVSIALALRRDIPAAAPDTTMTAE
jgi:hypothetical protein